jgi:hypothetical protein
LIGITTGEQSTSDNSQHHAIKIAKIISQNTSTLSFQQLLIQKLSFWFASKFSFKRRSDLSTPTNCHWIPQEATFRTLFGTQLFAVRYLSSRGPHVGALSGVVQAGEGNESTRIPPDATAKEATSARPPNNKLLIFLELSIFLFVWATVDLLVDVRRV